MTDKVKQEVVQALEECLEYFEDRADADVQGDPSRYVGNKEMQLLGVVQRALDALEAK